MKTVRAIIGILIGVALGYGIDLLLAFACVWLQIKFEMGFPLDTTSEPVITCIGNIFYAVEVILLANFAGFIFLHIRYSRFWEIVFWLGTITCFIIGVFHGIDSLSHFDNFYVPFDAYYMSMSVKICYVTLLIVSYPIFWAFLFGFGALGWKLATHSTTEVRIKKVEWIAFFLSILFLCAIALFSLLLLHPQVNGFLYR